MKSVIKAQPIYNLIASKALDGILHSIDKMRCKFLWAGGDDISSGKCKISWDKVCGPKDMGGLGVLDLDRFARALRLRWL